MITGNRLRSIRIDLETGNLLFYICTGRLKTAPNLGNNSLLGQPDEKLLMTPYMLKHACIQQPPHKNLNEDSRASLILFQALLVMVLCGQSSRVLSLLAGLSGLKARRDSWGDTLILFSQNCCW